MLTHKKKVFLDTNFLLIPGNFLVDIFSELDRIMQYPYELCMFKKSIKEVEKILATGNQRDKKAAKLALLLIKQKPLKTITSFSDKYVDDLIFSEAEEGDYVATMDKELKKRLKQKNIKIITLKQKKYLAEE